MLNLERQVGRVDDELSQVQAGEKYEGLHDWRQSSAKARLDHLANCAHLALLHARVPRLGTNLRSGRLELVQAKQYEDTGKDHTELQDVEQGVASDDKNQVKRAVNIVGLNLFVFVSQLAFRLLLDEDDTGESRDEDENEAFVDIESAAS